MICTIKIKRKGRFQTDSEVSLNPDIQTGSYSDSDSDPDWHCYQEPTQDPDPGVQTGCGPRLLSKSDLDHYKKKNFFLKSIYLIKTQLWQLGQ